MCQGDVADPLRPFNFEPAAKIAAGSVGIDGMLGPADGAVCSVPLAGVVGTVFCANAALTTANERIKSAPTCDVPSIGVSYPKPALKTDPFLSFVKHLAPLNLAMGD